MKLPTSPTPPSPEPPAGKPATTAPAGDTAPATSADSARAQLDRLQLANRAEILAKVTRILNQQQGASQQLLLDIRGKPLTVNAAIGDTQLAVGDLVKVMRAGNELQLLGKLAPPAEARIAQALAQRLPWQQRLDSGLAQLVRLLQPPPTSSGPGSQSGLPGAQQPPLPAPVRQAIEQVIARLPSQQSLSQVGGKETLAPQVRQWLAESGLFAEARLARGGSQEVPDLKLALVRVVSTLLAEQGSDAGQFRRLTPLASPELVQSPLQFPQPLPAPPATGRQEPMPVGQMLRLLAGMLNRVTVNQLHSQVLTTRTTADGAAAAPTATWLLELPWLNTEQQPRLAQLRIEHEARDREDQHRGGKRHIAQWRFSLAMDLDEMGPLYFEVALQQEQVSARVWAERSQTLTRVEDQLPQLRQGFRDLGLDVLDLDCRKGKPQGARTQLEHRLVDIRA